MSISIAALQSTDLKDVKKARSTIKSQITAGVNKLKGILEVKDKSDFNHKNISKTEVSHSYSRLEDNFQLFLKLHDRFLELREEN